MPTVLQWHAMHEKPTFYVPWTQAENLQVAENHKELLKLNYIHRVRDYDFVI